MGAHGGEPSTIRGSCLCGGVKYRITGPLTQALNCHCTMCRKLQGAAFRSRATVKAADFAWVQGESLVTFYESSPGNHRGFCRVRLADPEQVRLRPLALRSAARGLGR